jgi:hypothetical protein
MDIHPCTLVAFHCLPTEGASSHAAEDRLNATDVRLGEIDSNKMLIGKVYKLHTICMGIIYPFRRTEYSMPEIRYGAPIYAGFHTKPTRKMSTTPD